MSARAWRRRRLGRDLTRAIRIVTRDPSAVVPWNGVYVIAPGRLR